MLKNPIAWFIAFAILIIGGMVINTNYPEVAAYILGHGVQK